MGTVYLADDRERPELRPSGRFIAFIRQRPPGAPSTVPERLVIHEVETRREREWSVHVHPGDWSQDGQSLVGWQHDGSVVICRVGDQSCRALTKGSAPAWPHGSARVYFTRPEDGSAPQALWSINVDGTDERYEAALGQFKPIDRFVSVSPQGLVAWSRFEAGRQEVWTATVR
jgi:hypothetical protein